MTTTFTRWLRRLVESHGDSPALIETSGATVSYAELDRRVADLAAGLRATGVGPGARVASYLPNGILAVEVLLATARLGAVTIGVNTRYRSDDLRHLLEQGRPRLLVSASDFLGIDFGSVVSDAVAGLAEPPRVVRSTDVGALGAGTPPVTADGARPEDPVVAFTTSGSTGRPKLAAHDHASTIRHVEAAAGAFGVTPASVGLLALPICGTFGFVTLLSILARGGRAVIPPRFDVAEAAGLVETHRVTHLNASDDMILALLAEGRDLSTWREGVFADFTGRGEESATAAEKVGARLSGVYGSSETFALLTRWSPDLPLPARARNGGIPIDPAVEVRVVDPESGSPLDPGSPGELQIRGPSVLCGYVRSDGMADPPLTADGWLPTGDLAGMTPDGGFVYLARMGDSLRLAGFLTDPVEIEQRLLGHPRVRGAQVVGARRPAGGDVAVAFVIPDGDVGEAELVAHCRAGLANYKVPARVVLVDAFPTVDGANGVKIRKTALREQAADLDL